MKIFFSNIRRWVSLKLVQSKRKTKELGVALKREARETKVAAKILLKLVTGKGVSFEEKRYLKGQTADVGKVLFILIMKVIPGAFLVLIALEKVVRKYGFSFLPKKQEVLIKRIAPERRPEIVSDVA